jgi:protein-S-isoprenylcysteine O-methyltransferase Ste14
MARPEKMRRPLDRVLLGLLGLTLLLSIAPAFAHIFGRLAPRSTWLYPWLLIAAPQFLWCGLESHRQAQTLRGPSSLCPFSSAQGLAALLVIQLSMWTAVTHGKTPALISVAIALVIIAVGVSLRLSAIRALGERFRNDVAIHPGHQLEAHGIYGKMRHPSELGLLLILSGNVWLAASPPAAAVFFLASLPLSIWRSRAEDLMLIREFGSAGREYQQRTPAWISWNSIS